MAGIAKPNPSMVEARYNYIGGVGSQGSSPTGLFDGTQVNQWNTKNVMYWYNVGNYLEVELLQRARLWRSGTVGWIYRNANLIIEKFDDISNTYVNVTDEIEQLASSITQNEWAVYIEDLEPGRYKFSTGIAPYRIDSEWFFEQTTMIYSVFENMETGKYYTILDGELSEVFDISVENLELIGIPYGSEITLEDVPNFRELVGFPFNIISSIDSLDSKPDIIQNISHPDRKNIESKDLSLLGVDTIKDITVVSSGDIKHSISFDNGNTWYIHRYNNWTLIENENDGMLTSELNTLTSELIAEVWQASNFIRFRHTLNGDAKLNSIEIKVDMQGIEKVADTSKYSMIYDFDTKTISYNIKQAGTYIINYIDSK